MKKIRKFVITMLVVMALSFAACNFGNHVISANITDITSPGSTNITFKVSYEKETDYEKKGTDIYVKTNKSGYTFKIKKELNDFVEIKLNESGIYYSLTKLLCDAQNKQYEYTVYKQAVSGAWIINSDINFTLTTKIIVGDIYTNGVNGQELNDVFDISKECEIDIKRVEE